MQKGKNETTAEKAQKTEKGQSSSKKGTKTIDYILVIKEENLPLIQKYINNLKVLGFEFENVNGETIELIFIKVFISEDAVKHFSEVYDIGNKEVQNLTVLYTEPIYSNPFHTPISRIVPKFTGEITDAEKIMIVNKILENTKYGDDEKAFGLSKLIKIKILETAYPLHDGPIEKDGSNVRSLLFQHWAQPGAMLKEQPLDLIHRYFGPEVAFYFAWLEYFNLMLIIPSLFGAVIFLACVLYAILGHSIEVKEVCDNKQSFVCPTCQENEKCKPITVSQYCSMAAWTFVFDNHLTISFAVFMSFWAIIFLNLWKRKEIKLKMRWNASIEELDTNIRQAYSDNTKTHRRNAITGEIEPYTIKCVQVCKYTLVFLACGFLIGIIFVTVLLIVIVKIQLKKYFGHSSNHYLRVNSMFLSMVVGAIIQVACIKIFGKLYGPFSVKLTNFENPRTNHDFDNSVLYKRYLLSFTNNYVPLFYLAFIKGKLYSVPHEITFLKKDVCQPLSCIVALCLQLAFLMTLKDLAGNVLNIVWSELKCRINQIKAYFSKTFAQIEEDQKRIPQWEQEYFLLPTNRYLLTTEFTEMIIKYGFVTFFVAAFPLAPLCAFANNLIEARSDAYKLVKLFRRPVPLAKCGIGAWNGVLLSVTYLSTATNAFVIAFTSDWVNREVYRLNKGGGDLTGFVNSTLSKYDTSQYSAYKSFSKHIPFCYYKGYYYPPENSREYLFTQAYWMNLTFKFVAVFIFEHIILVCNAILTYSIPTIPQSVREQLDQDAHIARALRMTEFENALEKTGKVTKAKLQSTIKLHRRTSKQKK